jgi:hypothetical protein
LADNMVWHLPVAELPDAPQLGDVILDGNGRRWTILAFKLATLGVRWRCETTDVAIVPGLDDAISVQKTFGGSPDPVWQPWKTGIRARIQPLSTTIHTTADTTSTTKRYRIFVEENIDLDHTCRIRGADGTIYTIISSSGADQIGGLQVIEVESST